jgi:hypothetical protein
MSHEEVAPFVLLYSLLLLNIRMSDSYLNCVYHGSNKELDSDFAIPKRQRRYKLNENNKNTLIFDEESFHATPHKHIALAYMYKAKSLVVEGKVIHYNMGISLYEDSKRIDIFGINSLEESLEQMYGEGGYLYYFNKDEFIHKEGLGNLEVISLRPVKPMKIERIENPVEEMKTFGITFRFLDLALPKYEKFRTVNN